MSTTALDGVIVAETRLARVLGEAGRLTYAGYEIEDLAENASFEAVCHLLWTGDLPGESDLAALRSSLVQSLELPAGILEVIRLGAARAHPMATLQAATAAAAFYDPDAGDSSREAELRKATRLTAQAVAITAATSRLRAGRDPLPARPDLGLAANLLHLLHGRTGSGFQEVALDTAFTLHAEHGLNASSFAARGAAATGADLHAAVTAAVGVLKGPFHGGANERVMRMLLEIGTPARAREWVHAALARGERIPGFGHRDYRTVDPRVPILEAVARRLLEAGADGRWLEISQVVREVVDAEMHRLGKAVHANVDLFSASVFFTLGIPPELFPNVFACARMPGWTAHVMEQRGARWLLRPGAVYVGPPHRTMLRP
jgi:citrate synthase